MLRSTGLTVLLLAGAAYSTTLHVPSQYRTIQPAIHAAVDGDTVLVADGLYTGENNKNLSFLGKTIVVTSENGAENCIIDCENDGRGFIFNSLEEPTSVLTGFTIRHGSSYWGGGIYISDASPIIFNCLISQNTVSGGGPTSPEGGGIYCTGECSPQIFNCTVSENTAVNGGGGGISIFDLSSPIIDQCLISGNTAGRGGGIVCYTNNPNLMISHCTITRNTGYNNGVGGIYYNQGGGTLRDCVISDNDGSSGLGGGIFCDWEVNVLISHCTITGNIGSLGSWGGGGVFCEKAWPRLEYCTIRGNSAYDGAGILSFWSSPIVEHCTITENYAIHNGGGIRCDGEINIRQCTIARNSAGAQGGGMVYNNSMVTPHLYLENSIIEGNTGSGGIYFFSPVNVDLSYCDFYDNEGSSFAGSVPPGLGQITSINANGDSCDSFSNIFENPLFEDPQNNNFQITWANFPVPDSTRSPCIDAGDPEAPHDPDSTMADLGALYFDQGPVIITLIPESFPIVIPASGGSFDYDVEILNRTTSPVTVDLWCMATLPNGQTLGPIAGPNQVNLPAGSTLSRHRTQAVPAHAPAGLYTYICYLGDYPGSPSGSDVLPFSKLGAGGWGLGAVDWLNMGEEFEIAEIGGGRTPALQPETVVVSIFPNPFNPFTVISFELRAASYVTLEVFDVSGRVVSGSGATPTMYGAGTHQITFDGSGLPSGVYIYRLQAGVQTAIGKMVLLK